MFSAVPLQVMPELLPQGDTNGQMPGKEEQEAAMALFSAKVFQQDLSLVPLSLGRTQDHSVECPSVNC